MKYLMLIVLFITYNAEAIIIRHDLDDKEYRELGEQYSASIAYIRGGGCAATLINPKWLLTAAHCVVSKRSLTEATHLGVKYPIESVTTHPQFDRPKSLNYDIALIQLKKPIVKGSPVRLYKHKNEKGKPAVLVGSGESGNGLKGITKRNLELRGATNTIMGASEQHIKFKFDRPRKGKATRLEGISGPGDSGGPAFIIIDSQRYVAGVSSRQRVRIFKKEGHYGAKELYTRVSTYYPWIESVINPDVEQLLKQLVNEQRESAGLVGLGAVIIQNGKVIGPFVSGERKKGSQVLLTDKDKWHIGSITKPITATMIARLVEKGELSWNTTIKEAFPEVDGLNPGWNNVTLEHLLTHTAGVQRSIPLWLYCKKPAEGLERMTARETAVIKLLKKKPKTTPGDTVKYSNVGYIIAGVIAEKKTGMSWEELIKQEVFAPLQLRNGGFGSPQDGEEELSQPRGHVRLLGMTVSTQSDITPILGPAGTIHLSLKDLALYANEHLQGEKGQGSLLKTETFQRLHQPFKDNSAYGWATDPQQKLDWGTVLWKNGSNGRWNALLVILPDINAAIAVTTNEGFLRMRASNRSAWEIIKQLVQPLTESYNKSIQSTAKASAD